MKKCVFGPAEGITGELHGGVGTFRILIDKEIAGAKHFSLLVNVTNPGVDGDAHSHEVEHAFYILEGRGLIEMGGRTYQIGPGTAVYVPAKISHKLSCSGRRHLRYVVVYAPAGPEQELKKRGRNAFQKRTNL